MKKLFLVIAPIIILSSCNNNNIGKYETLNHQGNFTTVLDTQTGEVYFINGEKETITTLNIEEGTIKTREVKNLNKKP